MQIPSHSVRVRHYNKEELITSEVGHIYSLEEGQVAYNQAIEEVKAESSVDVWMIRLTDLDSGHILEEKTIRYINVHKLPPEIEQIIF